MSARFYKTHPHLFFKEYQYSIWVDAHILIKNSYLDDYLCNSFIPGNHKLAVIEHPFRDCTYKEAYECIRENKDDEEIIEKQMQRYLKENSLFKWV